MKLLVAGIGPGVGVATMKDATKGRTVGIAIFAALAAFAGPHGASATGGVTLEAWQIINLIGAPLLALLFVRPVLDDVAAWWRSIREQ